MAKLLTINAARQTLREVGVTLKNSRGEFRVCPHGASEDVAYYTPDLEDAVLTGLAMVAGRNSGEK